MVKVKKNSDTIALNKSDQRKVVKQTKKLKKKIQDGKITVKKVPGRTVKTKAEQNRGLIYIGHIPHGFYENEMKKYFKQFGGVTNVKVCRSNKSGNSKGFGYVEFAHPEVAKIAAETMNNYLMFKKRVVAEYVPVEKRPKGLFKGRSSTVKRYSSKVRAEKQRVATNNVDETRHLKRSSARLSRLNKKLQKLKTVGIDYDFIPLNVPERVKKEPASTEEIGNASFDSDVEVKVSAKRKSVTHVIEEDIAVKVPIKSKVKTLKKTAKKPVPGQMVKLDKSVKEAKSIKSKSPKKTPKKSVAKQSPKETPRRTLRPKLVTGKSKQ